MEKRFVKPFKLDGDLYFDGGVCGNYLINSAENSQWLVRIEYDGQTDEKYYADIGAAIYSCKEFYRVKLEEHYGGIFTSQYLDGLKNGEEKYYGKFGFLD